MNLSTNNKRKTINHIGGVQIQRTSIRSRQNRRESWHSKAFKTAHQESTQETQRQGGNKSSREKTKAKKLRTRFERTKKSERW